jgi:hypothetical protein
MTGKRVHGSRSRTRRAACGVPNGVDVRPTDVEWLAFFGYVATIGVIVALVAYLVVHC